MKIRLVTITILLIAAGTVLWAQPDQAAQHAATIADQMINRDDGKSLYRTLELITCRYRDTDGKKKCVSRPVTKKVESIGKDTGNHLKDEIELGIIIEPSGERGTAFLQKGYDDGSDSDQWIYFPSMKKLKRIVSQSGNTPRDGSVFGTEVAYEDVEKMHLLDYTYSYEGEERVDGRTCDIIIMTVSAKRAPKSSYKFMKVWVDRMTHIPLRSENYDRSGLLYKSFFRKNIVQQSGVWISLTEICVNHRTKRMTMQRTLSAAVNEEIDDSLFQQRALEDRSFREGELEKLRRKAK